MHCGAIIAVAAELLSKEFIEFKQNKYFLRAVSDSTTSAVTHAENLSQDDDDDDDDEDRSCKPLVIKISDIPRELSQHVVQMILENKRLGGGTVRCMEFSESERSAIVEYEERAGKSVDSLLVL